jgi:preprotein translocase subunit SecG
MITLLTIFHVIICLFLIFVVLLQQSSGADWAGAFGGGGSQTTFGARGSSTALGKATTIGAVLFMITSLALTILVSRPGGSSVVREGTRQENPQTPQPAPQPQKALAVPVTQAPAKPAPPK